MNLSEALQHEKYRFFLLITSVCGIISLIITGFSVVKHIRNQYNPWLQKKGLIFTCIPGFIAVITPLSIIAFDISWLLSFILELVLSLMVGYFFFSYCPAVICDQSLASTNISEMIKLIKKHSPDILMNFKSYVEERKPETLDILETKKKLSQLCLIRLENYKTICKSECCVRFNEKVESMEKANSIIKKVGIILIIFVVFHPTVNLIMGLSLKYKQDFSGIKILNIIRMIIMIFMWSNLSKYSLNVNRFCAERINLFAKIKIFQLIIVLILLQIAILSLISFGNQNFNDSEIRDFWLNGLVAVENLVYSVLFLRFFGAHCFKPEMEEYSTILPKESSFFQMKSEEDDLSLPLVV